MGRPMPKDQAQPCKGQKAGVAAGQVEVFTTGKIKLLKAAQATEMLEMTVEIFNNILLDSWDINQQKARESGPISFLTTAVANYFAFKHFESERVFFM
uniref:Uncharacterized protein n=1 Tax=Romanomermis culicivorax TaxID=13658 RepID=A0A915IWZ5_ROMCU